MEMRGKSYLSIGSVSMGIAGSMPDPDFFQEYLGMRNEAVDCSEIARRIELGIYDKEEFGRAMAWVENTARRTKARTSTRNTSAIRAKRKTRSGSMWSR